MSDEQGRECSFSPGCQCHVLCVTVTHQGLVRPPKPQRSWDLEGPAWRFSVGLLRPQSVEGTALKWESARVAGRPPAAPTLPAADLGLRPGCLPPGRSQQASPERLTRERKSLPKTGAAFSVSEHRHSCPGRWTHAQPGMEVGQDHPGREDGAPGSPHTTAQSTETLAGSRTSLERHLINIIHNEAF